MADEKRAFNSNDDGLYRFNFMVNILTKPFFRSNYHKWLKPFVAVPEPTFVQLIAAVLTFFMSIILYIVALGMAGERLINVLPGYTMILIAMLMLAWLIVIPVGGTTMLNATFSMLAFNINERIRRNNHTDDEVDVGIKDVVSGIVTFTEGAGGGYGIFFLAEGQLSPSTLPHVANETVNTRNNYLINRPPGTMERLSVSIREVDIKPKQDMFLDYYEKYRDDDTVRGEFFRNMCSYHYMYVEDNMKHEHAIGHTVLLRADDLDTLKKLYNVFMEGVTLGMYASVAHVTSREQIVRELGPIVLLSDRGVKSYADPITRNEAYTKK